MKSLVAVIASLMLSLTGCTGQNLPPELSTDIETETETAVVDYTAEKVDSILAGMTIEEKICQMMFVTPESITGSANVINAGETTRAALAKYPVGGIIYFAGNIKSREQLTGMISATQSYSETPLFIGVDEEGGRVARIANNSAMGTTPLPAMKTVAGREEAYNVGKTLSRDLSSLLFNLDFAPVADVIVYEKNSEIGDRSFGADPEWVADMVYEVVRGLEEGNVSSVLKHFPGHGSTKTNSHTGYSESTRTLDELRACEFLPFKKGIEAGCDFVMVSHMTLVNATKEKLPSSLSKEVITDLLKGELGFEGIVITDSLSMGAITKEYANSTAAVYAIKAGADMLLMPQNVNEALNAVLNAVNAGEITVERIDESVAKILRVKIEKGIIK